jgi:peptidoglycan hydrolase-like protein with peptidoglycan-binding domain
VRQLISRLQGPDVAAWQRFLTARGIYICPINGEFDSRTSEATAKYQQRKQLTATGATDDATVEQAGRDGFVVPQDRSDGEHFTKQSGVILSSEVERHLNPVAYEFYLWSGKDLVITSGTRTAKQQAQAMYDKLTGGGIPPHLYKDHQAFLES